LVDNLDIVGFNIYDWVGLFRPGNGASEEPHTPPLGDIVGLKE
jgi:hypothetical protein